MLERRIGERRIYPTEDATTRPSVSINGDTNQRSKI